jgi:DNA polymerase-3 subunit delta'
MDKQIQPDNLKILPWQNSQWEQVLWRNTENRLPHALLLSGAAGLGKKQFGLQFAHFLLCSATQSPCGTCHACHLIQAQAHPDLLIVEPEESSSIIKVDQIREVMQFVNETAQHSGLRVILINPANAMNHNAANALLKTLEEPAPNTILILISNNSSRLPATITSRCQKISFLPPERQQTLNWLRQEASSYLQGKEDDFLHLLMNINNDSPFSVKQFLENNLFLIRNDFYQALSKNKVDPLQLAIQFQEQDLAFLINLLLDWLRDILRLQVAADAELINFDYQAVLMQIAKSSSSKNLLVLIDHVKKVQIHLSNSLNLNRQLLLEEIFIKWLYTFAGSQYAN